MIKKLRLAVLLVALATLGAFAMTNQWSSYDPHEDIPLDQLNRLLPYYVSDGDETCVYEYIVPPKYGTSYTDVGDIYLSPMNARGKQHGYAVVYVITANGTILSATDLGGASFQINGTPATSASSGSYHTKGYSSSNIQYSEWAHDATTSVFAPLPLTATTSLSSVTTTMYDTGVAYFQVGGLSRVGGLVSDLPDGVTMAIVIGVE
jgi:hypothetical protein